MHFDAVYVVMMEGTRRYPVNVGASWQNMGVAVREIAVIDAESRTRETVVECFGSLGWEVRCSNNATDGAKLLTGHTFDLALIDAQLFGESGIDLFEIAFDRGTPVLMMSSTPDVFARPSKYSLPQLSKPFSAQKLQDEALTVIAERDKEAGRAANLSFSPFSDVLSILLDVWFL